jgi:hypothetical protein
MIYEIYLCKSQKAQNLFFKINSELSFLRQNMPSLNLANEDLLSGHLISLRSIPFYFTFRFQHLGFSEWITLFTLCVAPLAVHILVGAPEPVVLKNPPPRWNERLLHLNPTSIYWRYYAITIRRAHAKSKNENWSEDEIASTNAIFWVGDTSKWDGSEEMMAKTKGLLTKRLKKVAYHRVPLRFMSAFGTVVVTLQGIQALGDLFKGMRLGGYALTVALPTIFRPLAIAGLFRLPASLWLTDDYCYADIDFLKELELPVFANGSVSAQRDNPPLRSKRCWLVILVQTFFLIMTAALLCLAGHYFKPNPRITAGTGSTLLVNILYVLYLLVTLATTFVYTLKGQSNITIIPCINSTFYKLYTCCLFSFAFLVFIVAALETRKTSCGTYTTYPANLGWDRFLC